MLLDTVTEKMSYMANAGFGLQLTRGDCYGVACYQRGNVLLRVCAEDRQGAVTVQLYFNITAEDLKHSHLINMDAGELLGQDAADAASDYRTHYLDKLAPAAGLKGVKRTRLSDDMCRACAAAVKQMLPAITDASQKTQARVTAKLL